MFYGSGLRRAQRKWRSESVAHQAALRADSGREILEQRPLEVLLGLTPAKKIKQWDVVGKGFVPLCGGNKGLCCSCWGFWNSKPSLFLDAPPSPHPSTDPCKGPGLCQAELFYQEDAQLPTFQVVEGILQSWWVWQSAMLQRSFRGVQPIDFRTWSCHRPICRYPHL